MTAPAAGRSGDHVLEEGDQLTGALQWAPGDDRLGDAPGVGLVTEVAQDPLELLLARRVQHVGSAAGLGGVHAHVEWGIEAIAEAALGAVQLR